MLRGTVRIMTTAAIVLCGCANQSGARMGVFSVTAPVIAILVDDLFLGEAEGYMDRTGKITIKSKLNPDVQCIGQFAYTGSAIGSGRMQCNDGAAATFEFQSLSTMSGYGFGNSVRGPVSFTYGLTLEQSKEYLKLPRGKKLIEEDKNVQLIDI